ncbi:MAG: hypothetical protein ABUT39_12600 [Acidobacteriota bacterium]
MEPNPPSPFDPGRLERRQPKPEGGPSRTRPLLIGCGAVFVLLGIATVILIVKLPELSGWVFQQLELKVMEKLPPDVTPEERQRLDVAFDDAARAVGQGKTDPEKVQELNTMLMEMGQPGRILTHDDILKLTHDLEEVAGKTGG